MTPEQKIKWLVLSKTAQWSGEPEPNFNSESIDDLYDELVDKGEHWDGDSEVRCCGVDTGLLSQSSRHYEADEVAAKLPDGSWVGWTYWHGGGKHGEPEAMPWMSGAYDVDCVEEEKVVTVRSFSKR